MDGRSSGGNSVGKGIGGSWGRSGRRCGVRNLVGKRENRGIPWKSGLAGATEFGAKGIWASGEGRRSREGREDGRRILDDEFRDGVWMLNRNFGRFAG